MIQVEDRITLIKHSSVHWFTGPHMNDKPMPITGNIEEIDDSHWEGEHHREYKIRFDDGRYGWYAYKEILKI